MKSIERINSTGSVHKVHALLGLSTRVLSPHRITVALLAMVLAGMALWSTPAYGQEAAEPVWSADMTVVEYSSVSMGAASADLFSNVGGSGNLQIKSLWSHIPGRDLRLAFQEGVPDAADYTLQAGGLSLEFPAGSSSDSSFKWNDVDVDWEDGQVIHVRIVPTAEIDVQQTNIPASGAPAVSGTAQVGEPLTADTSSIADADGLSDISYAYQWIRTDGGADADIAGATDSTYTLTDDDLGKTVKLKVTFTDDKGNSETLSVVAASDVGESEQKTQFLVSNLGVNVATGIMRPLSAARSGFAQAFTTGTKTGGYPLGSVGVHVSHFYDGSTVGDHLRVTINGVASGGEPGDAHCTLTNPSSFSTPGVIAFETPASAGACPQLAAETIYFIVIEWVNPSGTGSFALIPQTYPTEETAATEEDPGGAEGWSIADKSYYLAVSSDVRTWTAYDETASFKIKVEEGAAKPNTLPTGLPTISGTAQVGETLTADTSAIADEDGLDNVSYSYQWLADDSDIGGATGSSHTLTDADQGKTIKVKVSFTDDAENQESLTSAATGEVAAQTNTTATGLPTISGTAQVGETLTADTSAIADEDGLDNVSYSYQWVRNDGETGTDINDATDSTYTLTDNDAGKTIRVRVSFTDDADNHESLASLATGRVEATKPGAPGHLRVFPHDTGALDVDWHAPASDGGSNITGYKVQWKESADGWDTPADLSEETATGTTHTITGLTDGVEYTVRVRAVNDAGEGPPSAEASGTPQKAAIWSATLTVGVVAEQFAGYTTFLPDRAVLGALSSDAITLDDANYTVKALGVLNGKLILSVTPKLTAGFVLVAGTAEFASTGASAWEGDSLIQFRWSDPGLDWSEGQEVAVRLTAPDENTPATGEPTITGTNQVGETLTANTSAIADTDGLTNVSYSYQWIRNVGGTDTDIGGETASTYTLTGDDVGKAIKVRVTFTDDADNQETLTSTATAAVAAAANNPATGLPTISGTPQVDETVTANTSPIADQDGLTNATFEHQWIAGGTDIDGATGSSYELTSSEQGQTIQVRVSFTDDVDNQETLTSAATDAVAAKPTPLTASFSGVPESHDGQTVFTFELHFSEEFKLSYVILRDHAFKVTGGEITKAKRLEPGKNSKRVIHVRPDGDGAVTIVLPATTDCDDDGAICTEDDRMLSNRLELTVVGPGQ